MLARVIKACPYNSFHQVKGVGVALAELKDVLLGTPLVSDCAVIGIPDTYAGEVPKAFVVLADSEARDHWDTYCRTLIVRQKWLVGGTYNLCMRFLRVRQGKYQGGY